MVARAARPALAAFTGPTCFGMDRPRPVRRGTSCEVAFIPGPANTWGARQQHSGQNTELMATRRRVAPRRGVAVAAWPAKLTMPPAPGDRNAIGRPRTPQPAPTRGEAPISYPNIGRMSVQRRRNVQRNRFAANWA